MVTLPLPLISGLILSFLFLRMVMQQGRLSWLAVLVNAVAAQAVIVALALHYGLGHAQLVPRIVDMFTAALLLGVGLLALGASRFSTGPSESDAPAPSADDADHALVARLEEHMRIKQAWREPELTLTQLARRLGVPAKRLSVAVNLVTGDNISRYVNGFRIKAACDSLAGGANATEAMFDAGFLTKSNFNREFRRVTGQTPTEWRAARTS